MISQIKTLIKYIILPFLFKIGMFDIILMLIQKKYVILMYHGVYDDKNISCFNPRHIPLDVFRKHIYFFKKHFDVIPLSKLAESIHSNTYNKRKKLVITFDDGYKNNLLITKIITKNSIPITIFITINFISRKEGSIEDKVDYLISRSMIQKIIFNKREYFLKYKADKQKFKSEIQKKIASGFSEDKLMNYLEKKFELHLNKIASRHTQFFSYLRNEDLRTMSKNDFIEFGSHGMSHINLGFANEKQLDIEISNSREILQSLISKPVKSFSYPYGVCNSEIKNTVSENYSIACAIHPKSGIIDLLELTRVGISAEDNFYIHLVHIIKALIKNTVIKS